MVEYRYPFLMGTEYIYKGGESNDDGNRTENRERVRGRGYVL